MSAPVTWAAGDICPDCESIGLPGALCPFHAAAPELLAALKSLLGPDPASPYATPRSLADAEALRKQAREAIAKAGSRS